MRSKTKDVYMYGLGAIIVLSLLVICVLLIFHAVPAESEQALNIALGALIAGAMSVITYFFGSSKGSADKTEMMKPKSTDEVIPPKPTPKPPEDNK